MKAPKSVTDKVLRKIKGVTAVRQFYACVAAGYLHNVTDCRAYSHFKQKHRRMYVYQLMRRKP